MKIEGTAIASAHYGAQTCAQHHISSIGCQTAGPVETQIGTNTHWDNGQKLRRSAIASARKYARSTTYPALAPKRLDRLNPKLIQKPIGPMDTSYGVGVRNPGGAAVPRENEREAREYRDGTGRRNRRERKAPPIQHWRPKGWTD
jgi:hypothetical protein